MRRLTLATAALLALVTGTVTFSKETGAQPKGGEWFIQALVTPPKGPVESARYPFYYPTRAACEGAMHEDMFLADTAAFVADETKDHGEGTGFTFSCEQTPGQDI